jgi:D-sedoheptulose 7-phosphate isomerase
MGLRPVVKEMTMEQHPSAPVGTAEIYFSRLQDTIARIDKAAFNAAIDLIRSAWFAGKQIIVFGNGGSALTAQHFVTDWNKSLYLKTGRPFRGVCLAENIGLLSAYANDISYQDIFVEQLKPTLSPDDLVIGISGSGNSENVLRAIRFANDHDGITLGVCGYDGGELRKIARHSICADVNDMQLSEDIHLIFGHITMQTLCGDLR